VKRYEDDVDENEVEDLQKKPEKAELRAVAEEDEEPVSPKEKYFFLIKVLFSK